MFENLRANIIERVYKYMESKDFIRGQKVYQEGDTEIDGLYFIIEGDFEMTQVVDSEVTKTKDRPAKRALLRTNIADEGSLRDIVESKSRSQIMLAKLTGNQVYSAFERSGNVAT